MIFPENIGEHLSIDEVALSQGELYTFLTNKAGRGKKGTLVASIQGTQSKDIIKVLKMISIELRSGVKEVTLDMARNMEAAVKEVFPNTSLVTDRFHVVKLAMDAVQHVRIKQRWEELDIENEAIEQAKKEGVKYQPPTLDNGDTPKQLLARSRYVLAKKKEQWTQNQSQRADLLFQLYPQIETAYNHVIKLRAIYEHKTKQKAREDFLVWLQQSEEHAIKQFNTVANTLTYILIRFCPISHERNCPS